MAVDPRKWIYSFLDYVPGPIAAPARWIADRIFGVFDDGVSFLRYVAYAFRVLKDRAKAYADNAITFAMETVNTFKWLAFTELPRRVKAALDDATRWAATEITKACNALTSAINTLRTWAEKAVAALDKFAHDSLDWAKGQLTGIRDYLNKTVGVWYGRLTDPRKFAAWIVAAITTALLAYLYGQRDKISAWLLRSSPSFTVWLAKSLEDILKRLL